MKKPERVKRGIEGSAKRRGRPPKSKTPKKPAWRTEDATALNEAYRSGVCFGYAEGFSAGQAFEMGTQSPDQVMTLRRILSELSQCK